MAKDTADKGYTVLDTVKVEEHMDRELPNSDPAKGNSMGYQDQPWQKQPKQ